MGTPDEMMRSEKTAERAADWLADKLGETWQVDAFGRAVFVLTAEGLGDLSELLHEGGRHQVSITAEALVEAWRAWNDA